LKKINTQALLMDSILLLIHKALLQRNESGRVGSTNTRSTMLDWLVCDGEFTKVMTNHFRLIKNKQKNILS
jgi:hypothetical protein